MYRSLRSDNTHGHASADDLHVTAQLRLTRLPLCVSAFRSVRPLPPEPPILAPPTSFISIVTYIGHHVHGRARTRRCTLIHAQYHSSSTVGFRLCVRVHSGAFRSVRPLPSPSIVLLRTIHTSATLFTVVGAMTHVHDMIIQIIWPESLCTPLS